MLFSHHAPIWMHLSNYENNMMNHQYSSTDIRKLNTCILSTIHISQCIPLMLATYSGITVVIHLSKFVRY